MEILRARIVLPVTAPPLADGAVAISGGVICGVGPWPDIRRAFAGPVRDLGEVVLLPGLVNAHCHLDYTDMAGMIPPRRHFTDWIQSIVTLKASWSSAEFSRSWQRGARMLLRNGITTVGNIEALKDLLVETLPAPMRMVLFHELINLRDQVPPEVQVAGAVERLREQAAARRHPGLSPHAPYTTTPALLRAVGEAARTTGWPVTMHVAESAEEDAMIRHATGTMYDWLKGQRDVSDCGQLSPVALVAAAGLLNPGFLAVHANCVDAADIALLANSGCGVVHCPRSHDYFQHPPFPLAALRAAGVNVCLGTDSLASVTQSRGEVLELDLFAELRMLRQKHPGLDPATQLEMVTVNGARALGLAGMTGALEIGLAADVLALPYGGAVAHATEAAVHHSGSTGPVFLGGERVAPAP